ncbi:RNA-directed DNA polymerase [Arenibacter troitsensis]|uniref:Reverse transcriptase (RNA-dependent DNA polymerase) n=1 Tax=Arenibacter troitsensis TaxID=188872 RepID=A0A1X7KVY3_9FLAO|nr:RNA-directed DNA polymerase [Arenibacter troitsensis]SMG45139.1 Reverse transcriptase (RNA-dependent DNA polymerase) [Arenibacter troitsensis]
MDTVFQQFKRCAIKINTEISGVPKSSSGFLIKTTALNRYDYIFTAKHSFYEDDEDTEVFIEDISFIEILAHKDKQLNRCFYISNKEISKRFIEFEVDLVIILIDKIEDPSIPNIQVSDNISDKCMSWSITSVMPDKLQNLDLTKSDPEDKRYTISKFTQPGSLKGCSGSGILSTDRPVLHGFIMRHPTEELEGQYIDAVDISFSDINSILVKRGLEPINIENESKVVRVVNDSLVVNLEEVIINEVRLNLINATTKVEADCVDDWFHDPLSYVDLRGSDFLFKYFHDNFLGKRYQVTKAETFFLPKSSFTLRKALVMHYPDRLYYTELVDVLGNSIDSCLIPEVYSSRYSYSGKGALIISGVEQWKKIKYQIKKYSHQHNYIIEIDILNFYDNINTDILCDKLLAVCCSPNERIATEELRGVLNVFSSKTKSGIPQNNDASSLLGTFYLNEVDTYMTHLVPKYLRFMDDIKIFCDNEFQARRFLRLIEMKLRELKLSLNSQKTRIINLKPLEKVQKEEIQNEYRNFFNLKRSKLSALSLSDSIIYRNEAFHLAINLVIEYLEEDSIGEGNNERTLLQALTILKKGKVRGISIENYKGKISKILELLPKLLKERPWLTTQIVYLIAIIDNKYVPSNIWNEITEIVTEKMYNTYPWQCYHLWLLLAKHKISNTVLSNYVSNVLDSNDVISRPVVAAMMIYMGSIDENYKRIVLNKYKDDYISGSFQERAALITLRSFTTEDVCNKKDNTAIHESLHKHKDKELIYINGECDEDYSEIIQMYSL